MKKSLSTWGNYLKRFGSGRATKGGRNKRGLVRTLRCEWLESRELLSVYYVNATGGATSSDAYDGLSPTWTSGNHGPWQTVAKVNAAPLVAGDSVLFNRGQVWRESLLPKSGDATGVITYGAYGTGANPIFMGSTERDNTTDWTSLGNNIWTDQPATTGSQLLSNPSFASNLNFWTLYNARHGPGHGRPNDDIRPVRQLAGRLQDILHERGRRERPDTVLLLELQHHRRLLLRAQLQGEMHFRVHPRIHQPDAEWISL